MKSPIKKTGWLRAAVLGGNDGIVSTSSLVLGVAASHASHASILVAGVAGLVAGAMSMGTGEFVSVHAQADTERAAIEKEREELKNDVAGEHRELAAIYVRRGVSPAVAKQVAHELMARDALGAHARDELGISRSMSARPLQAALASACSFAGGSALPLLIVAIAPDRYLIPLVFGAAILCLAASGALAAYVGQASVLRGALRVTFWSALAMGVTAGIGALLRATA